MLTGIRDGSLPGVCTGQSKDLWLRLHASGWITSCIPQVGNACPCPVLPVPQEENQRLEMELTQVQHCLECLQQEHTEACGELPDTQLPGWFVLSPSWHDSFCEGGGWGAQKLLTVDCSGTDLHWLP